ncbi:unnamed protein product [Adineta steineri]|uniref:Uncharacterized protein n=1 Tax=Adineta steineri TaxID=433720 RepID=A0A814X8S1_9BILA|nr:unnamed protein product [Adineta steineri]CAF1500376.1 unnamed protein product [Adineta steineri]
MEIGPPKSRCIICDKEKRAVRCEGCLQLFCYDHLTDHRQELNKQLDYVERTRDVFRQTLNEQMNHPQIGLLVKQIDIWEDDSIKTIRETASEYRQLLAKNTSKNSQELEANLAALSEQIRRIRQENDFNEVDLAHFNQKLKQLAEKLFTLSSVSIPQDPTPLIYKLSISTSPGPGPGPGFGPVPPVPDIEEKQNIHYIPKHVSCPNKTHNVVRWKQHGSTIAGKHHHDQLSDPLGLYIDYDDPPVYYVADYGNHRVVRWRAGTHHMEVLAGGNGKGKRLDQLNYPTDLIVDKMTDSIFICDQGNRRVIRWSRHCNTDQQIILDNIVCWGLAMDDNGDLYVSDYEKDEVRRWTKGEPNGILVAGGNGKGSHLNQLNYPSYIFVDDDHSIYVSDSNNNRVMKWPKGAKEGIVVAGGHGPGNSFAHLCNPQGVMVGRCGHIFVADSHNHRVVRWSPDSDVGTLIVGGHGQGSRSNQFSCPIGLSFDRLGSLCVVDWGNNRVQKFDVEFH